MHSSAPRFSKMNWTMSRYPPRMTVSKTSYRLSKSLGLLSYTCSTTSRRPLSAPPPIQIPVDVVEGIGGFTLDVLGVWTFNMRNAFGQAVTVEACIIDGCTDEFLVGVDFFQHHKATMDFEKNEVRYGEKEQQVVIPFRTDTGDGGAKVAAVRLVSRAKLTRSAVTPVEVAVAAPDGEQGVFVPTMTCGSVMLAATVTTSRNGTALVPMINVQGSKAKLPSKKELGVWIPLEEGMQVLALSGELVRDNLDAWLIELGARRRRSTTRTRCEWAKWNRTPGQWWCACCELTAKYPKTRVSVHP
jgi:hypothetical protein